MAIPTRDSELVPYGANFDEKATASPVTYGLTAAQALNFHTAYNKYLLSSNAVSEGRAAGLRSKALTATRNTDKRDLLVIGRELYGFIQDNTSVAASDKLAIGVNPKTSLPSPVPAPGEPTDFKATLVPATGALVLTWKCPNARGCNGVMYTVSRKVDDESEFTFVGLAIERKITDDKIPAGSTQVTYRIQAARSTSVGTPATFIVQFGSTSSGGMTAAVVAPGGAPKLAA